MKKFFALFLIVVPMQLFAQAGTTEVGASVAFPIFETNDFGTIDFEVSIDGNTGYGLTLNHFWTDRFSTELAAYSISGDASVSEDFVSVDVGEIELTVFTATAQFHFRPGSRVHPYLGAGLARLSGGFDPLEADDDEDDFESEVNFVANAGVAVNLTERLSLAGDIKYIPYEAREAGGVDDESAALDPTIFSLNLKLRF